MAEFKITKKSLPQIKELKGKNDKGVINPQKILDEIDNRIERNMKMNSEEEIDDSETPLFYYTIRDNIWRSNDLRRLKHRVYQKLK